MQHSPHMTQQVIVSQKLESVNRKNKYLTARDSEYLPTKLKNLNRDQKTGDFITSARDFQAKNKYLMARDCKLSPILLRNLNRDQKSDNFCHRPEKSGILSQKKLLVKRKIKISPHEIRCAQQGPKKC